MEAFAIALACVVGFAIGFILCDTTAEKPSKTHKVKTLEELSDRELFAVHVAVFNEIARRGAEMVEPFEEFK